MLKLELSLRQDQITGFSYSFAKALLDRLHKLLVTGTLYELYPYGAPSVATELLRNLCHYLGEQIPHSKWGHIQTIDFANGDESLWKEKGAEMLNEHNSKVQKIIQTGYDFLSTFEKK